MSVEQLTIYIPLLALSMMRAFGITILLPIFNTQSLPDLARMSFVLLMSIPIFVMHMHIHTHTHFVEPNFNLILLLLKELVIGIIIGFVAAIPFWAINMAGFIIDTARGASMATVLDPIIKSESSIFGQLFTSILTVLFFITGAFHLLLSGLYDSYQTIPLHNTGLSLKQGVDFIIEQWALMADLSARFALPALICMLMVDISLGLINRTAQQLNVFILSMPIKSVVVLFVLIISIGISLAINKQLMLDIYDNTQKIVEFIQ